MDIGRLTINLKEKIITPTPIEPSQHYSLTPSLIEKTIVDDKGVEKDNPAYQPILDIAKKLNEEEIKNIALTVL